MQHNFKTVMAGMLVLGMTAAAAGTGCAPGQPKQTTANSSQPPADTAKVVITPGSSAKKLRFTWYSQKKGTPAVQVSKTSNFKKKTTYKGRAASISKANWKNKYTASNKVATGSYFSKSRTYYYRYTNDVKAASPKWSKAYKYVKKGTSSYKVAYVGDPQIGCGLKDSSQIKTDTTIAADALRWNKTLAQAKKTAGGLSFILSAGDQVDYYNSNSSDKYGVVETEYAALLGSSVLRNVPLAAAVGNHDDKRTDYKYHFNNPNSGTYGKTGAGYDYYFRYGNTLYMVINSNNTSKSSHKKMMAKAVKANKSAKWRVAMLHHDIYGSGKVHSNTDAVKVRKKLAPLMDQYKVDVCLTGHDHSYCRSYQLKNGKTYKYKKKTTVSKPKGTLYLAMGASAGNKHYDLASKKQYYVAERKKTSTPTYAVLSISSKKFVVKTYKNNGKKFAKTYTIKK